MLLLLTLSKPVDSTLLFLSVFCYSTLSFILTFFHERCALVLLDYLLIFRLILQVIFRFYHPSILNWTKQKKRSISQTSIFKIRSKKISIFKIRSKKISIFKSRSKQKVEFLSYVIETIKHVLTKIISCSFFSNSR